MATDDDRLVQNQRNFRHANTRLGGMLTEAGVDGQVVAFLCECPDELCLGRIEIRLTEYDEAHLLPNTFVIVTGHARMGGDEIVEEHGLFEVVQKS